MDKRDDCYVEPMQKKVDDEAAARSATAALSVTGMGCVNCASRVRNALLEREGVYRADVDHVSGMARVRYDASAVDVADLLEAVAEAGRASRHVYGARSLDVA